MAYEREKKIKKVKEIHLKVDENRIYLNIS